MFEYFSFILFTFFESKKFVATFLKRHALRHWCQCERRYSKLFHSARFMSAGPADICIGKTKHYKKWINVLPIKTFLSLVLKFYLFLFFRLNVIWLSGTGFHIQSTMLSYKIFIWTWTLLAVYIHHAIFPAVVDHNAYTIHANEALSLERSDKFVR